MKLLRFQSWPDSKIRSPLWLRWVRRMDLGRSLFAAVFPEFIAREEPGQRGTLAVKGEAQGWCGPQRSEDTALRALTARHRGLRSREKAMNLGKDDQRPKGKGCAENHAARRAPPRASARPIRWVSADQAQPGRQHVRGAKRSAAGMG